MSKRTAKTDATAPSGEGKTPPEAETPKVTTAARGWMQCVAENDDKGLKLAIEKDLTDIAAKHAFTASYLILFLWDEHDSITNFHSDRLYAAASVEDEKKDILLILHSGGGLIEPAYLISKTLKRLSKQKFVVAIPRRAKSAATLLSLGADEIHMGMMSQLGPVDPQLGGMPALSVANAMTVVADLVGRYPAASEMLTKYLASQVPIQVLGYYHRVVESAVQYAERLLAGKTLAPQKTAHDIADHLVNHYKDHGFVIDYDESRTLLGDGFVKEQTAEYKLADEIYRYLDFVSLLLSLRDKQCWYVGKLGEGFTVRVQPGKS